MIMVLIRTFKDVDRPKMLEIEKLCPQGDEKYAMGIRKTDIFSRYRMYDNWKVMVAEEEGRVVGWIGWTVKSATANKEPYTYLVEVMVHPKFRRRGVASKLVKVAEESAREAGSDYIYCYIFEPNSASRSLFEMHGYSDVLDAKICEMAAYKKAKLSERILLERLQEKDLTEVTSVINKYNAERMHYAPFTSESFQSHLSAIPGYGPDNFWVAKTEGRIVSCAGLWDSSCLFEMCYTREPLMWKMMGSIMRLLGRLTEMQKIPAEGEYFKLYYITDHAFDSGAEEAMQMLLGHFNNLLLEARRDYLAAVLDESDPLFRVIEKLKPQIEINKVYAKPLKGELPAFSPFYVDIRDLVL